MCRVGHRSTSVSNDGRNLFVGAVSLDLRDSVYCSLLYMYLYGLYSHNVKHIK